LISRVQSLSLNVFTPAKIVINERTGTIVLGGDVKLTPVSVIHGNLSIEVVTTYTVAPVPGGIAQGYTERSGAQGAGQSGKGAAAGSGASGADTGQAAQNQNGGQGGGQGTEKFSVSTPEALVPQTMRLDDGANVDELVNGLHAIGTTARDVVAILQAIKAEGGLQAELEVQ
jgi:flagellar P-ring protein precursor FlgI